MCCNKLVSVDLRKIDYKFQVGTSMRRKTMGVNLSEKYIIYVVESSYLDYLVEGFGRLSDILSVYFNCALCSLIL